MVLKRASEQLLGLPVRLAINITDVNDKIYVAAAQQGVPSSQLADQMAEAYRADTEALGLGRPDVEPLASQTIAEIIDLIERLIEHGAAYASDDGDVYFSVAAYPQYGELSGQRVDELIAGSRVEPGEGKRSPLDFALWKANKPDEDSAWDSPWGRGRPGWHIECSAMASAQLGEDFDVHGGGLDLIFPHHENERAQSEAAGERFARVWMHNGMLRLTGEKMSKSLGNIDGLAEALERVGRETLLVFFAQAHYRSPVDYSDTTLEQASRAADGLREALRNARRYAGSDGAGQAAIRERAQEGFDRFAGFMADDLDTPRALAELHGIARAINTAVAEGDADARAVGDAADVLVRALDVLGLASLDRAAETSAEALSLAEERAKARSAGDFALADELRDRIAALGFAVRDTPQGPQVVPLDG
jgi:cysteinyl-tRNA synthetase